MNLIIPCQRRQQFYATFIKRRNPIYQIFWGTLLPQSKMNNFPRHLIKSLFQISKYKKYFIFGSEFFSKSPQNKHIISSASPWHKAILHFINIHHLMQTRIQNFLMQFKSMFQQFYSILWIKGIPLPFKTRY